MNKKEYNIVVADPAKNITVFVLDDVDKNLYKEVAKKIFENTEYDAEQVGFLKEPIMGGDVRLEMMGGEFCGNASRSVAMYYARENNINKGSIKVEITGSEVPLTTEVDLCSETAKIEMPIPKRIETIAVDSLGEFPIVIIEGINHIIAENIEATEENFDKFKKAVYENYDVEAFGVMFIDFKEKYMVPVVYVRDTDTTFFESSCGSGSLATISYLGQAFEDGEMKYDINQPGGIIATEIYKEKGNIKKVTIGGVVKLTDTIKVIL